MRPLVGFGMVAIGGVLMFGGITGRLAPMLGALFAPSTLTEKGSGGGSSFLDRYLHGDLGIGGLFP